VTPHKVSPSLVGGLPTLSWWIIKVVMIVKSHIGSLLGEIELYK
jgi:hypothetical protein